MSRRKQAKPQHFQSDPHLPLSEHNGESEYNLPLLLSEHHECLTFGGRGGGVLSCLWPHLTVKVGALSWTLHEWVFRLFLRKFQRLLKKSHCTTFQKTHRSGFPLKFPLFPLKRGFRAAFIFLRVHYRCSANVTRRDNKKKKSLKVLTKRRRERRRVSLRA